MKVKLPEDLEGLADSSNDLFNPEYTNELGGNPFEFGRDLLRSKKKKCPKLSILCFKPLSENEVKQVPIGYFLKSDILMRKRRSPVSPADEKWNEVYQSVVLPLYRDCILQIAHDIPVSGHFGVNKTHDRITRHFLGLVFVGMCHTFVKFATLAS